MIQTTCKHKAVIIIFYFEYYIILSISEQRKDLQTKTRVAQKGQINTSLIYSKRKVPHILLLRSAKSAASYLKVKCYILLGLGAAIEKFAIFLKSPF